MTEESKEISSRDKLPIEKEKKWYTKKWFTGPSIIFLILLTLVVFIWDVPYHHYIVAVLVVSLLVTALYRSILTVFLGAYRSLRGVKVEKSND